jgi:hypothetical protein
MTPDVLPRSDVRWHLDGPGVVVGNHVIRSPVARGRITTDETSLGDLDELQRLLVNGGAIITARSKVVNHWPMVAFWPFRPLELELATSSDLDIGLTRSSATVADDVWAIEVRDEPAVLDLRNRPASNSRWRSLVLERWVVPEVVLAISHNTSDDTVSSRSGRKGKCAGKDSVLVDHRHGGVQGDVRNDSGLERRALGCNE